MAQFEVGDRVRVDIPDERDPDHDRYHCAHGTVIEVVEDDAGAETGEERDSRVYRLDLETGETMDFRQFDLRPAFK